MNDNATSSINWIVRRGLDWSLHVKVFPVVRRPIDKTDLKQIATSIEAHLEYTLPGKSLPEMIEQKT